MLSITRRFEFDSGHRVLKHESKCKFLHGHRYVLDATIEAEEIDALGRVLDFGEIKHLLGGWIDEKLDHNVLLNYFDPLFVPIVEEMGAEEVKDVKLPYVVNAHLVYKVSHDILFQKSNPTAENIVQDIGYNFNLLLDNKYGKRVTLKALRLYETPNCWADLT